MRPTTANLVKSAPAKQYKGTRPATIIRYGSGKSSLGAILVAASDSGICAVTLSGDPELLRYNLQSRFPKAELQECNDADFKQLVAKVVRYIEAPSSEFELPLDIRGTAFQQRVWQALREIPPGTTVSYTDIAKSIGMPNAVRAVAGACAANNLAVAIPCHRVIRKDGDLSGFGWGVERKAELLRREQRV